MLLRIPIGDLCHNIIIHILKYIYVYMDEYILVNTIICILTSIDINYIVDVYL